MSNRNLVIDDKILSLKNLKTELQEKLNNIPKPNTNLILSIADRTNINIRTCKTISTLYYAYSLVSQEALCIDEFNNALKDFNIIHDVKIGNWTISEWKEDIINCTKKLILEEKLKKIENALIDLEKYYTDDRKEEIAFDNLLSEIDKI